MKPRINSSDPDIRASFAALKRAAKAARKAAEAAGAPCYVVRDGRIVDVNAARKARKTPDLEPDHSHSIVAGGLELMS
jgi:hypothetical protein